MNKSVLLLLALLLVAGIGAYLWINDPAPPAAPAPVDPVAQQPNKLPRGGAGVNQSAAFETIQHREETETVFAESLRFLAPGAAAPLVRRTPAGAAPARSADGAAAANAPARNIQDVPVADQLWSGVILVPTSTVLGFGHTALADLRRIEVHPRTDRRMRVWARLGNTTAEPLQLGVACGFRTEGETDGAPPIFETIVIPSGGSRDVVFLSPKPDVTRYTVLVRR